MARIILFSDPHFRGDQKEVYGHCDLTDFNNRTSSIIVLDGCWELFLDPRFGRLVAKLYPGLYRTAHEAGIPDDEISSLRPC